MAQWREITTMDEWKQTLSGSSERPVLLLKHSTTCPVSANALSEFEGYIQKHNNENIDYALVKVIESRPVSNQIAEDLQVKHESPQVILMQNGEQAWNTSHWSVTAAHIDAVLS